MKDQKLWHPEVTMFSVWDQQGLKDEVDPKQSFLGYLYLDLYPRDNKYGHAAVWGLIPSYRLEDGSRQYSTSAMVANLASAYLKLAYNVALMHFLACRTYWRQASPHVLPRFRHVIP